MFACGPFALTWCSEAPSEVCTAVCMIAIEDSLIRSQQDIEFNESAGK